MFEDLSSLFTLQHGLICLFAIIGIAKTVYLFRVRSLMWSFRSPFSSMQAVEILLLVQIVCYLAMIAGYQEVAILGFISYLFLFHFSIFYGLENVIFQILWMYFSLQVLDPQTRLPDLFLAVSFALVFLSAAMNKVLDPIWQKGLGAFYFFSLPVWSRIRMDWAVSHPLLAKFVNYGTILVQLSALVVLFVDLHWASTAVFAVLVVFGISLSTLFVMSWVGEILAIGCALLVLSFFTSFSPGENIIQVVAHDWVKLEFHGQIVYLILGAILFAGFYNSSLAIFIPGKWSRFNSWMRTLSRYSTGICVTKVFTSLHILGPAVFRIYAEDESKNQTEVFKAFKEHGFAGSYRNFRPTFVESIATKITEIAMELDAYGKVETEARAKLIEEFCKLLGSFHPSALSFRFDLMQLIPPKDFSLDRTWITSKKFEPAFRVHRDGRFEILKRPILEGPTGRELHRASFSFKENLNKSLY